MHRSTAAPAHTHLEVCPWAADPGCAQAALSDVFAALSGATGLKHLNLYGDQGVSGPMASPMATTFGSGVCALARSSLLTLQLMGVNGSGALPPCLLGTGSRLEELNLGA